MPDLTAQHAPFRRIDAWLAAHAPTILQQLRPPLDAKGLARLETALGRALPPSLAAAYRAHNGAKGEHSTIFGAVRAPDEAGWARWMWWLPLDKALKRRRGLLDGESEWEARRLPIAEDAGGDIVFVDLESGAVATWDQECGDVIDLADDFGAWMAELADDMEARLVGVSEDEDDHLELLAAALTAPAAAPVAKAPPASGTPAEKLIDALVAQEHLALVEDADKPALIAAITAALGAKGAAKRRARVVAALEESDEVDEVFADDETLAAVIDTFS